MVIEHASGKAPEADVVAAITSENMLALAERFMTAVATGDIRTVREIYADDAVIWHNNDRSSQGVEENLRVLEWMQRNVADLRYEEVQRLATETGFVEQHVLRGRTLMGAELEVPACLICTVVDGRITRLEEYLDSAHLAPLFG
jgi:ketosteroid isomerase-like protein